MIQRLMRLVQALCVLALAAVCPLSAAAEWMPQRPVRIIVPFAAGGPTDTVARIIAEDMSVSLGQPVYVDNVAGEGGSTGVKRFLAEASDGHTLLMGHMGTHGVAPVLTPDLGYDPEADFQPIGLVSGTPIVVTVREDLPVSDLRSLRDYMRAQGKAVRLAHAGRGSVSHAGALSLSAALGVSPTLISYPGTGPALNDLVGHQADVLVDQIVNIAPAVAAKKVNAVAMASRWRSEALPNVPTAGEVGISLRIDAWNALFATRKTPMEQIAPLHRALRAALNRPGTRARLLDLGAELPDEEDGTPGALAALVDAEIEHWSEILFELR